MNIYYHTCLTDAFGWSIIDKTDGKSASGYEIKG
jgi:hypothetical protein